MVNSSLFYEVLMYLNSYYFGTFVICEILLDVFKIWTLPYPFNNIILEVSILLLLCCVEYIRIYLGRKGNLTVTSLPLIISNFLLCPSVTGIIYLLLWQTYVLRLEVILCYIQLVMQTLEFIISVICIITFYKCSY